MAKKKKQDKAADQAEEAFTEFVARELSDFLMNRQRKQTGLIDRIFSQFDEKRTRYAQTIVSDLNICPDEDCELRQGVAVAVPYRNSLENQLSEDRMSAFERSILITAVEEHGHEYTMVMLDVESAKKFVNAIGSAIAVAEKPAEVKG